MTIEAGLPGALASVLGKAPCAAPLCAPLDREWIAAHIPHGGAMCLLDTVEAWDETHVRCTATSHRAAGNPLRSHGRLAAVCGVEYAAQAMAVHGALLGALDGAHEHAQDGAQDAAHSGPMATRPRVGYLASVRNVETYVERLDTLDAVLAIEAERVSGAGNTILYGFTVRCNESVLLTGRAAVVLDASAVIR